MGKTKEFKIFATSIPSANYPDFIGAIEISARFDPAHNVHSTLPFSGIAAVKSAVSRRFYEGLTSAPGYESVISNAATG